MALGSKIGWTDGTWNPWVGCHKVTEECRHCYIQMWFKRTGYNNGVAFGGPLRTSVNTWKMPMSWNRLAVKKKERYRVFTCSLSDFFHEGADGWRDDAWEVIRNTPNLDYLILTKRPENILARLPKDWNEGYSNVWLGTTCGYRETRGRIDILLQVPAKIKFISAEPLLEAVDYSNYLGEKKINWVITGCEQAGKDKRRFMELDWVRSIRDQCNQAEIAFFHKQHYRLDKPNQLDQSSVLDGVVERAYPKSRDLDIAL